MPSSTYKTNRRILLGQDNNALVFLFAINALVFVLINVVKIIYFLSDIPIEKNQIYKVEDLTSILIDKK